MLVRPSTDIFIERLSDAGPSSGGPESPVSRAIIVRRVRAPRTARVSIALWSLLRLRDCCIDRESYSARRKVRVEVDQTID
jgi:hypothetical protein